MSKLVDERVVEMRFDNKDFEKNTRQSMSTIQKLKASLNFGGVSASINKSVSSVDMSPIEKGLKDCQVHFSTWEKISLAAIENVTNKVVDLGIELVKSLSVDNITSGWAKFEQLTKSTGTIISQLSNTMDKNAASELTNEYMEKLMWFADATSYSLTDMTSAIGKFIAKGKDMDTSFNASVGIANWAASAGKNAQEAQGAFEALAKVSDHVLARNWYSIQAANMDTIEFKNAALEAAVNLGTLTKSAERFDGTVEYITKKGNLVTAENFTDAFSDEWFTMEALLKVLGQYGTAVQPIMDLNKQLSEELGTEVTADTAIAEYTKQMEAAAEAAREAGDAEKEATAQAQLFGVKQLKAAQEARTLSDAINAVKDAVSTGWLTAFQTIIGTYQDATNVFSILANKLVDIFLPPLTKINNALTKWSEEGGHNDLFAEVEAGVDGLVHGQGALWNFLDTIKKLTEIIKAAWRAIFPVQKSVKSFTENLQILSEKVLNTIITNAQTIQSIFKGLFSVIKLGIKIVKGIKVAIQPILDAIKGDSGKFVRFLADIGERFSDWVDRTEIFTKVGAKVAYVFQTIIDKLKELQIIHRVIDTFKTFIEKIKLNEDIQAAWLSFKRVVNNVLDALIAGFKGIANFLGKYVIPALANIAKYLGALFIYAVGAIIKGVDLLVDSLKKFVNYLKGNEKIQNVWSGFVDFLKSIPDKLKKLGPFFKKLGEAIAAFFRVIWNGIVAVAKWLGEALKLKSLGELFSSVGEKIGSGLTKMVDGIKSLNEAEVDTSGIAKKLSPLQTLFKGIIDLFKGVWAVFKALIPVIGKILSAIGNLLTMIADGITNTFNKDIGFGGDGINLWYLINGGIGLLIAKGLYDFVWLFASVTSAIANTIDALGGVLRAKTVKAWAGAIKTVAEAILMLVASIIIITLVDESKLKRAVTTLITIMSVMAMIIVAMGKFLKGSSSFGLSLAKGKKGLQSSSQGFFGVASMIAAFGAAILMLVIALKMIDKMNQEKIVKDLAILTAIMVALAISVGIMNSVANVGNKTGQTARGIKGLFSFALAVFILMIPIKKLGELPLQTLKQGVGAIATVLLAYGATIRLMNGLKPKGVGKMMSFAMSMLALVAPITLLSKLDSKDIWNAVGAISVISLAYGAMALMASKMKITSVIALGGVIMAFKFLMGEIADLVEGPISRIDKETMLKFAGILTGVLAFLGALTLVLTKINKNKKAVKGAKKNIRQALAIFAIVLAALAGTFYVITQISKEMNEINWNAVLTSISMLGAVLLATAVVIKYSKTIVKRKDQFKPLIKKLVIFAAVAGAIVTTMAALAVISNMMKTVSWSAIFQSITLLTAVMVSTIGILYLAKAIKVDTQMLKNIAAVVGVMTAMGMLAIGLSALVAVTKSADIGTIEKVIILMIGTMLTAVAAVMILSMHDKDVNKAAMALLKLGVAFAAFGAAAVLFGVGLRLLQGCVKGLIIFAALLVTMGVAMKLLGSTVPTMLTIAVAFGVMGLAALAIGGAFYLIVLALEELLPILDELAEKSDSLTIVMASMIQGILEGIANAIPVIIQKVLEGVDTLIQYLEQKFWAIIDFIKTLDIGQFMEVIAKLVDLAFAIVIQVLDSLAKNIGTIIDKLITILIGAIDALIARLPELMSKLVELILSLIDGLGQAIEDNAAKLRDTIIGFCKHLWNAFLNFFGIHSPSKKTEEAGGFIMEGIVKGIGKGLKSVVKVILDVGKQMLKGIGKLPKEFMKIGFNILKGLWDGMKSVWNSFIGFLKDVWEGIKSFFGFGKKDTKEEFRNAGKEMVVSYQEGMEEEQMDVNKAAKAVIEETIDILSKTDIFQMIGESIVEQISTGIEMNASTIALSVREALEGIVEEVETSYDEIGEDDILTLYINKLLETIQQGLTDEQLTIRPVMDLSDIKEKTAMIAAGLAAVQGITINGSSSRAETVSNEMAVAKQNTELASSEQGLTNPAEMNQNGAYSFVFNMYGVNDPKELADQVSKIFQQEISRRNA